MTATGRCRITLGISCTFALLLASFGSAKSTPKQDRSWKRYRNSQLGYCLTYPSRWVKGEGFDGAGFWIESGEKKFSKPLGAIDVAVLTPPQPTLLTSPVALAETFQVHLEGLQKFERAEQMEVLEKRDTQLLGAAALYVKDRYYDPMDRATWIEELLLAAHDHKLYRLELECRSDQLTRFEPVFARVTSGFQFECADVRSK